MRQSLKKSLAHTPAGPGWERYPKGAIVLCNACAKPIFKLDHAVVLGDKAGRVAKAFKPLSLADLTALADREDIDAGLKAMLRGWDLSQRKAHVATLKSVKTGDPMMCPTCHDCFVQIVSVEKDEVLDKAYTVELLTVNPAGPSSPIRGKHISATGDWIH